MNYESESAIEVSEPVNESEQTLHDYLAKEGLQTICRASRALRVIGQRNPDALQAVSELEGLELRARRLLKVAGYSDDDIVHGPLSDFGTTPHDPTRPRTNR